MSALTEFPSGPGTRSCEPGVALAGSCTYMLEAATGDRINPQSVTDSFSEQLTSPSSSLIPDSVLLIFKFFNDLTICP